MPQNQASVVAVDIGASSGRVVHVEMTADSLVAREVARFPNAARETGGALHWDAATLLDCLIDGVAETQRLAGSIDSIGIDTWGVDYGWVDAEGHVAGDPWCYRDRRTEGTVEKVAALVGAQWLYARTGTSPKALQTIYQLFAELDEAPIPPGWQCLLMPDLLGYGLTHRRVCEVTNASTTGLLNPDRRAFDHDLMHMIDIPHWIFPELVEPGTRLGPLRPGVRNRLADASTSVVSVASHDTASAVVAVPMHSERAAFLSCGTWSILGCELRQPVLTADALAAGFSNELGADDTVRFVCNIAGLWPIQECVRTWGSAAPSFPELLDAAGRATPWRTIIDPDRPDLVAPGDMPARLGAVARQAGEPVPESPAQLVRCILDSLAVAFRRHLRSLGQLTGMSIDTLHLVGGGVHNALLCQLTADACEVPVVAGPAEASSLGNALVQGRPLAMPGASLGDLRALVRASVETTVFEPSGDRDAWAAAETRQCI